MASYMGYDVTRIPEYWEEGAKELEKTTLGKIVTSPIRIIEKLTGSAQKIAEAAGTTATSAGEVTKKLPLVLVVLAVGVAGYLVFAGKSGTSLMPGTFTTRKNPCGSH